MSGSEVTLEVTGTHVCFAVCFYSEDIGEEKDSVKQVFTCVDTYCTTVCFF